MSHLEIKDMDVNGLALTIESSRFQLAACSALPLCSSGQFILDIAEELLQAADRLVQISNEKRNKGLKCSGKGNKGKGNGKGKTTHGK